MYRPSEETGECPAVVTDWQNHPIYAPDPLNPASDLTADRPFPENSRQFMQSSTARVPWDWNLKSLRWFPTSRLLSGRPGFPWACDAQLTCPAAASAPSVPQPRRVSNRPADRFPRAKTIPTCQSGSSMLHGLASRLY